MIKEIYKSANESIDTKDAFARISKELYEKKPERHYGIFYGIAAAAACAVITCTMLFNMPESVQPSPKIQIAEKSVTKDTYVPEEPEIQKETAKNVIADTDETEQVINKAETKKEVDEKQVSESVVLNSDTAAVEEKKSDEKQNKSETTPSAAPIQVMMNINNAAMRSTSARVSAYAAPANSVAGGGGISEEMAEKTEDESIQNALSAETEETQTAVSYEEYCEYIGCDIRSEITDFTEVSPEYFEMYKDFDGNIIPNGYTFSFEKNDEFLYVTLTKNLNEIKEFIEFDGYEKSTFAETEAVITKEHDIYNVYFIKDNTAYTVSLANSSEEELKNVVLSLIQ